MIRIINVIFARLFFSNEVKNKNPWLTKMHNGIANNIHVLNGESFTGNLAALTAYKVNANQTNEIMTHWFFSFFNVSSLRNITNNDKTNSTDRKSPIPTGLFTIF